MRHRRPDRFAGIVAVVAVVGVIALISGAILLGQVTRSATAESTHLTTASGPPREPVTYASSSIRNVVLVLADDLDWRLWDEVPRLKALQERGTTLTNYVVSDSLCCPSRTTIFRGQYVHNHQVLSNEATSSGGWPTFRDKGYPSDCLPTWLTRAGVRTGLIGKYLNEYPQTDAEATSKPPGWDDFIVPTTPVGAYRGYDYTLSVNGVLQQYGSTPRDFLNDVLDDHAARFLATATSPFFLELASFTPHLPSPVAVRHKGSHKGAKVPRDDAFNAPVVNPPSWLDGLPPLTKAAIKALDRTFAQRAESAESFADSVQTVLDSLVASGHDSDTLVIVTSDNGFHMGSYRTRRGKRTAFDADTVVPFVAIGPGVTPGKRIEDMVSETDLGPTVAALLGSPSPDWVDGASIVGLLDPSTLAYGAKPGTRTAALSESLGLSSPSDPDFELLAPPTFTAMHTRDWLYVESLTGERELYDRRTDPLELTNVIDTAPEETVLTLQRQFEALRTCTGPTCHVADSMPTP